VIDLNVSYRFYEESFIAYIQGVTLKITDIMAIRHKEWWIRWRDSTIPHLNSLPFVL